MLSAHDYRDKHICKDFPNCPRGASRTFAHGAADVARRMAAQPALPPGAEGRVLEAQSNVKTPREAPVVALPGVPTTQRQLAATEREHCRDADSTHHATDTTELNAEDCLPKDLLDKTPSPTLAHRVPHPPPTQHRTDVDVYAWYESTVAWVAETDKTLQVSFLLSYLPPVPPPPSNLAPDMLPYSFEEWCARLMRWHTVVIGNFSAPQQQEALPPTMCSMYTYPNPWQPTAGNAVMPQYYGAMRPPIHMGIKQPMLFPQQWEFPQHGGQPSDPRVQGAVPPRPGVLPSVGPHKTMTSIPVSPDPHMLPQPSWAKASPKHAPPCATMNSWPPSVDPQNMAPVPQVKTYAEEYPPLAVVATKTAPPNDGAKAASHKSKGPTPPRPNHGKHAPPSATMNSGPGPQVMANSSGPLPATAFMECPFGEWCNISKSEHVRAYHLPGWTPKRFENFFLIS